MATQRFHILVTGGPEVGKTCFIHKQCGGDFIKSYNPTDGVAQSQMTLCTSHGQQHLMMSEVGGPISGDQWNSVSSKVDAAIVMFDVSRQNSYDEAAVYCHMLRNKFPDMPIVLCGNKVDRADQQVEPSHILLHKYKLQYFHYSVKSNFNYEKPILHILRELLVDKNVILVEPYDSSDTMSAEQHFAATKQAFLNAKAVSDVAQEATKLAKQEMDAAHAELLNRINDSMNRSVGNSVIVIKEQEQKEEEEEEQEEEQEEEV